ncbi:hypothetical protein [Candidatus Palauibacter sp.]|uniref:hypothetical protein n=1 Tax=Candidatus Palauibacter sp. TaxID=3101350 RepID=UPI003CC57542
MTETNDARRVAADILIAALGDAAILSFHGGSAEERAEVIAEAYRIIHRAVQDPNHNPT